MKRFLLLLAMAAAAACSPAADFSARLMSFNVRMSAGGDGENCWENRRDAALAMITACNPDCFGVQEAMPDQMEDLRGGLPEYSSVGVPRDGDGKGECMAVFYRTDRLKLLDSASFWLSETPREVSYGWDAACRRTATFVRLKDRASRTEFAYINTHLDHMGPVAREESVKLLVHLADSLAAGIPVVIGGDLNSGISPIFQPFLQAGFVSARVSAPVTDGRGTYNGWGTADEPIDHFFVRGFETESFRVVRDDFGVPFVSDHYPIEITLAPARERKTAVVLGDSYSTFYAFIPEVNDCWYFTDPHEQNDVCLPEQTWWRLLCSRLDFRLVLNQSWSGATVCNTGYNGKDYSDRSFVCRADECAALRPDLLFICGGTNDSWAGIPVGELKYSDWTDEDLYCFLPAFCRMLDKIRTASPSTRIVNVLNSELSEEVTSGQIDACAHYGVECVLLEDVEKGWGHPSVAGMQAICDQVAALF